MAMFDVRYGKISRSFDLDQEVRAVSSYHVAVPILITHSLIKENIVGKQARLNQQYRTRMQAALAAQEQELLALMPGAVNAPMWERQGKEWNPDLHVTWGGKMRDSAGWQATIETLSSTLANQAA
jgi:L-alanine-DL-glutamate epimerase-like enolase superfamily enzyme